MITSNKILITGPESSGKSTLCRQLAWATDGQVRPEVARAYLSEHGPDYQADDLARIWAEQVELERSLALSDQLIFCDTAHFVMSVWNRMTFRDPRLEWQQLELDLPLDYRFVILCAPDLPWTPDPLREHPSEDERIALYHYYLALLPGKNIRHTVIRGKLRFAQCLQALQREGLLA